MKLENQVCTLEQGMKLKELGVVQESLFYWSDFADNKNKLYIRKELGLYGVDSRYFSGLFFVTPGKESGEGAYSAYTVAELGVLITGKDKGPTKSVTEDYWHDVLSGFQKFNTEAQARAALLIYRLERGLDDVSEINKRLLAA